MSVINHVTKTKESFKSLNMSSTILMLHSHQEWFYHLSFQDLIVSPGSHQADVQKAPTKGAGLPAAPKMPRQITLDVIIYIIVIENY